MTAILLDTGPLVAVLNSNDDFHDWAVTQWKSLRPPMLTCEAVLVEAIFRLEGNGLSLDGLWELLRRKILEVDFDLAEDFEQIAALMRRYADLPMDLADACIVRMAEQRRDVRVFTIDRDFKIYRRSGRQMIPLIFPN